MLQFFLLNMVYLTAGAVLGTYLPGFLLAYSAGLFTCAIAAIAVDSAHDFM